MSRKEKPEVMLKGKPEAIFRREPTKEELEARSRQEELEAISRREQLQAMIKEKLQAMPSKEELQAMSKKERAEAIAKQEELNAIIRRLKFEEYVDSIHYSQRYSDDSYEYRHVILPKGMLKMLPKTLFEGDTGCLRILNEEEWREIGIVQSAGWEHYEIHAPEPHVLLFRRPNRPLRPEEIRPKRPEGSKPAGNVRVK